MSDDETFTAIFEQMPPTTQRFYVSLLGSRYFEHYKQLLVRYATHQAGLPDLIRITAFNIHILSFTVRESIKQRMKGGWSSGGR